MKNNRNPYIGEYGAPTLKRSVVAFIDILGYVDLVKNAEEESKSQELLTKLHRALNKARRHVDPDRSDSIVNSFRDKDLSAFRAFTDNIVIGHPIHDDGEIELGNIFNDLSYFQMIMTIEGFFIRGAISIGDLYMDDITVYGSGLVEAYEAELNLSRDPRIILAESARTAVNQHLEYYGGGDHAPQNRDLLKDSDGQYFVNYLDTIIPEHDCVYEDELRKHKEIIEKKLIEYKNKPPIWSKYMWAANYHNYFCEENSQINDCLKVDTAGFNLKPARIV